MSFPHNFIPNDRVRRQFLQIQQDLLQFGEGKGLLLWWLWLWQPAEGLATVSLHSRSLSDSVQDHTWLRPAEQLHQKDLLSLPSVRVPQMHSQISNNSLPPPRNPDQSNKVNELSTTFPTTSFILWSGEVQKELSKKWRARLKYM